MSPFYQKNIISCQEAQKKLNSHLSDLKVIKILHSNADTRKLIFIIYSEKHDNSYYFSIGTSGWTWIDSDGRDIPIFSDKFIDGYDGLLTITDEVNEIIKNKLIIKKVELIEKPKILKIYFENNSVLETKKDTESEDQSYYQLSLFGSKLYQNYDLLIKGDDCKEEIVNGNEQDLYKVALFDLDYFRKEHRSFTTHAINQARERKSPVSFIQAEVLHRALTTSISGERGFTFSPWGVGRSLDITRLDTIPIKELIIITRNECEKNNFTIKEAEDILKSTIDLFKEWVRTEENLTAITEQEYGSQSIHINLIRRYEEIFET